MAVDRNNPTEIARETFRLLAQRRVPPTPANFERLYHEVAGSTPQEAFPSRRLKSLAASLPRDNPEAARSARRLEQCVAKGEWDPFAALITELCSGGDREPLQWGPAIRDLVGEYERVHHGLTAARKREALQHVLTSTADAATLHQRVGGLIKGWRHHQSDAAVDDADSENPGGQPAVADEATRPVPSAAPVDRTGEPSTPPAVQEPVSEATDGGLATLIAQLLDDGLSPLIVDVPDLVGELHALAGELRDTPARLRDEGCRHRLDAVVKRLEWVAEEQVAVRSGLVGVLRLILQNISQLVFDDRWLHGQLSVLNEAFADKPIDVRTLDDVERRLRDVIDKQGHLKQELSEAQRRLKTMLAGFVDRLAEFSATTGEYHDAIGRCAERVAKAEDITEISDAVEEILQQTRIAQGSAERSHREINALKDQVEAANVEIGRLQHELDQASEMVRHDALTGALNRKGMDDALAREISRARRRGTPLCIGLLDVDNFKQLNDTYGHHAGDDALRHLAAVIRENVRPQDSVARYGGEEFVIVLPDTDSEDAMVALTRLQRALTKRYFLAGNSKLLITFSAGITRIADEENAEAAIARADRAMYLAKRAGKNRVMTA
ncbi:MAG: diguanylate cyclase [Rhodocyclaceae bacterium]|nr:diguanylate cyclase [Rhodocyclaceae bacterium]